MLRLAWNLSTSLPNQIQVVSLEMAMELVKHGKKDWVSIRSDLVAVKGKEEMRTYWLKVLGRDLFELNDAPPFHPETEKYFGASQS